MTNTTTILTPEEMLETADRITEATGLTTQDRLFVLQKLLDTIRRRQGIAQITKSLTMMHLKTLIRCYEHMQEYEDDKDDCDGTKSDDCNFAKDA